MVLQVFTDLYVGNALEATQGSLEILQDGPLASYCFVQKYTNSYFSEEERQWIADTILRCRYLSPETLRAPLNFSDEAHSLESIASIVTTVNTLGVFLRHNPWIFWNISDSLVSDYYLGIDLANKLLGKRNPELSWLSSVEKKQYRKEYWQSVVNTYPREKYFYLDIYDEETGWPTGQKEQYSNERNIFYQVDQIYPKATENILKFFNERATSDFPTSYTNIPVIGAKLSKLQLVRIPGESILYRMRLTMDVCKTGAYGVAVGLLAEAPYTFSNATYAAGTLNWVRHYNWLMHQLWPEGITEVPITAIHTFFDKNTKKLVEVEFNKLPPYEHTKWDQVSIDTELYGKAVNLKTLTSDPNAPDILFVPARGDSTMDMGLIRAIGGYSVTIEEH
jgi:hypothetical protein